MDTDLKELRQVEPVAITFAPRSPKLELTLGPSSANGLTLMPPSGLWADGQQASLKLKIEAMVQVPLRQVVAQEALKNLWRIRKYLDAYVNRLEGAISEQEFETLSDALTIDGKYELSVEVLRYCASYLKALLPDLEFDDLAALLNVDIQDVVVLAGPEQEE